MIFFQENVGKCGEFAIFAKNFVNKVHEAYRKSCKTKIKCKNFNMRFIGDYLAKTDAKGRVFLPAALRKTLTAEAESKLVLRKDVFQKCLVLYPESVWNEKVDDLKSHLNLWKREHQEILRKFSADAELLELDSNGRFLIAKSKLQYAEIGADVRFLGVDDTIEVWSKEKLDQHLDEDRDLGNDIENLF